MADTAAYPPLTMPLLVLAGAGIEFVKMMVEGRTTDIRYAQIEDTGHYVAEEQPEALAAELERFFG